MREQLVQNNTSLLEIRDGEELSVSMFSFCSEVSTFIFCSEEMENAIYGGKMEKVSTFSFCLEMENAIYGGKMVI